ncbi:MAG: HPF/RaiA family ribosome-associated protein [Sphaerimonospora mesophila]
MSDTSLSIEITGIHLELDKKTTDYTQKKIAKLIDYIPKKARTSAFASVKIAEVNKKDNNKYECEAVLTLPDKKLFAKESAPNALAAVDIVEAKLRAQISKYKTERRADGVRTGGFMAMVKRSLRRK